MHVNQVKRYEAGTSQPSLDALKRIAVAFSVTTDSLLFEDHERAPSDDLTLEFEALGQTPPDERRLIRDVLSGLIPRYQASRWSNTRARQ